MEVAEKENAVAVAHGCTGKGNDQVRFEVSIKALNPDLEVLAPVREWKWSRDEEIDYAQKHGIPIPINLDSPYSIDQNLWGRSNECGILEDPWAAPPEGAYDLTTPLEKHLTRLKSLKSRLKKENQQLSMVFSIPYLILSFI